MSWHEPLQQSVPVVHAVPVEAQTRHLLSKAHVPPPQHASPATQACSSGTHAAHCEPSRQKPLQQSAVEPQDAPASEQPVHRPFLHERPSQH
jgi:hypothetical protein